MLIVLLDSRHTRDPKMGEWLAELGRSSCVLLATHDEQLSVLLKLMSDGSAGDAALVPGAQKIEFSARPLPSVSLEAKPPDFPALTDRQRSILSLVAAGLPNKVISSKLDIAFDTVRSEMKKIFRIMGVQNRTQAALRMQK